MKLDTNKVSRTRDLPKPNLYAKALINENLEFNYDEEKCLEFKAKWRQESFGVSVDTPMDLEIGTGNGFHFAHYVQQNPDRRVLGLELKYKPLIQSVKRCLRNASTNFRMLRYSANYIEDLFADEELDNVFIHFPDPWGKERQQKHRLLQACFFQSLYRLQRPGSFVEFKTDHQEYFEFVLQELKGSPYIVTRKTFDLHNSEWASQNFQTHFEKLWTSKGLKSHMLRLEKKPHQ